MTKFEEANAQLLGLSVDSMFALKTWAASMGGIRHPLLADFWPHGGVAQSLEGRGVLASTNQADGCLSVWSSTQTPQALKTLLCDLFNRDEDQITVRPPDLGGGFGMAVFAGLVVDRALAG